MTWNTQPDPINTISGSGELDLSAGTVIATGSTASRTLASRFAEVYNVKNFEATGDGSTDDTDAIQDAIDEAPLGGVVLIPPGTYRITTLTINKSISVIGLGAIHRTYEIGASVASGVILEQSSGTKAIHIQAPSSTILNGIHLEGFELKPSSNGGGTDGIYFDSPDGTSIFGVLLERVAVRRFGGSAVIGVGTGTGGMFDFTFRDCNIENWTGSGSCVDFVDGDPGSLSNQIKLYNCFISSRSSGVFGLVGAPFELYGTIVQDAGAGANGVDLVGGGIIIGGNIEGAGSASTTGVRYTGSVGCLIYPGSLSNWDTGVSIGDGTASVAAGAVIYPTISNNATEDILLTAGGSRQRTTLINHSSATVVTNTRFTTNGEYELHTIPHATVIATASLPAASAAMNGTIIIEDGGADDRNLVIYAGGQRFRIDGGANV